MLVLTLIVTLTLTLTLTPSNLKSLEVEIGAGNIAGFWFWVVCSLLFVRDICLIRLLFLCLIPCVMLVMY